MSNDRKKKIEEYFACPWCGKAVVFEAGDNIITKAVAAEKTSYTEVRKDTQTSLDEDVKKAPKKVTRKKW